MVKINNIPQDINAELIFDWLHDNSFKIALNGQHKRNAYNDLVEIEHRPDDTLVFHLGRNGLYHSLPEYLFHPLDRFNNLSEGDNKEIFSEEIRKQEIEKENAVKFFEPIDLLLMIYKVRARRSLRNVTEENSLMIDILSDHLTDSQKRNRFIIKTLPFLSFCRNIRGNKTLLSLMLRKVFIEEGLKIDVVKDTLRWEDENPHYSDSLGEELGISFVGNVFDEDVYLFYIDYIPETIDAKFPSFLNEIEEYRLFISEFFISVEQILLFSIKGMDTDTIILGEEESYNYLNYNTTL